MVSDIFFLYVNLFLLSVFHKTAIKYYNNNNFPHKQENKRIWEYDLKSTQIL